MHNEVKVKIGKLRLDVVCLVETKVWREVGSTLLEMLFSGWGYEIAYSSNDLGRIWVFFFFDHRQRNFIEKEIDQLQNVGLVQQYDITKGLRSRT